MMEGTQEQKKEQVEVLRDDRSFVSGLTEDMAKMEESMFYCYCRVWNYSPC